MKPQPPTNPRPKAHVPSHRVPTPAAPSHAEVLAKAEARAVAHECQSITPDESRARASIAAAGRGRS
jgi:hypothetical protein